MKRILKNSMLFIFLFTVALACKEEETKTKSIRPVRAKKVVGIKNAENSIMLPASINELRETKLSFRVGGPLIKLNDVIGSYVQKGEVIAQLDPRDFKIAIEATESRYKLAKAEYERYKNLVERESVSKSVFDQMETNYKLAKTEFESASNAYNDTEIKAPFSGYINQVFVNNYEEVMPGALIISLLDMSKFEVNAWISVNDAVKINEKTLFTCVVKQGNKDVRIPGTLKEIGTKTSLSKQSLPITIVIHSTNVIELKAGMTTYLEIANGETQNDVSYLVPATSIFSKDNKKWVWVFNENSETVSAKQVTIGKVTDDGNMEISNGLSGSETVVTAGANYLFEGQQVKKLEGFSKSNVGNKL